MVVVVVQEARQEELSWVMASLIARRDWDWDRTTAMSWSEKEEEEEVAEEGAGATTSAAIAEFMMIVRIER